MDPIVNLVRRWAVDWLAAANPAVCPEILAPEYAILIGGFLLGPRETYIARTCEQLDRFPGLGITIHELICTGDRVAVRFTEHGAAVRPKGGVAAWGGVALFRGDARRLVACAAEEDYLGRRRQLAEGRCDPVEAPAAAPWSVAPQRPDPDAEAVVRAWLDEGEFGGVELDDGWTGRPTPLHLCDPSVAIGELFSAGSRVAFHGRQTGTYGGGLDESGAELGAEAGHTFAGIVRVEGGAVVGGRVVRDRLGLQRALATAAA